MRRSAPALAALLVPLAATALSAQSPSVDAGCPAAPAPLPTVPTPARAGEFYRAQLVRDACQKAVDLFQFMAPQLGTAVAGGNAVLGRGGAFGGVGRFSLGIRANVVQGSLPQLDDVRLSTSGPQRTNVDTRRQLLGLPAAELSVGVFPGVSIGITRVGGVDAIVSGFYVPNYETDGLSVRTDGGALKLGYGGRLGIIQETTLLPGVSVTYLRRDLPRIAVTADVAAGAGAQGGDTVRVTGFQTKTGAWRLVASKRLPIVGFAVGAGQDTYDSRATLSAYIAPRAGVVGTTPYTTPAFSGEVVPRVAQKLTRTNYFADVQLNLFVFKLVGEVGRVSGGNVAPTFNTFGTRTAGDSYNYGSLGVRVGF
jgi:hypothetical protein